MVLSAPCLALTAHSNQKLHFNYYLNNMKTIAIKGDARENLGKSANKTVRQKGMVPCVVYGGNEVQHFSVYEADFKNLVYTPNAYLVRLDINGQHMLAKLQDIQYHPVSEAILHADFMQVFEDRPIKMDIPVKVTGNSPGVRAGGKLIVKIKKLKVQAMVKDLPEFITADISSLEIGKNIRVKSLQGNNFTLLDSPENSVVSCSATRASIAAAAEGK
jgi:large subunit ribosomal protein L25